MVKKYFYNKLFRKVKFLGEEPSVYLGEVWNGRNKIRAERLPEENFWNYSGCEYANCIADGVGKNFNCDDACGW